MVDGEGEKGKGKMCEQARRSEERREREKGRRSEKSGFCGQKSATADRRSLIGSFG